MDNMLPDVSVVVAAYNVEKYIENSIRSALSQKNVNVEIIVVDDASSDETAEIASGINDPRVRVLRQSSNGGTSQARNTAIKAATAPWIAVLDGDDTFAPDRLSRMLELARKVDADVVVDNLEIYREADDARYPMFAHGDFGNGPFLDLTTFIRGNVSFQSGRSLGYIKPIFSAAFLNEHNLLYDTAIAIGEDYMLMAETLACGARYVVDPAKGYNYTVRAGSTSHRLKADDIQRMIAGDERFLAKYRLSDTERQALVLRTASAKKALQFAQFVDAIKGKQIALIGKILYKNPLIICRLWPAINKRIRLVRSRCS